jgi:hypothetical protein
LAPASPCQWLGVRRRNSFQHCHWPRGYATMTEVHCSDSDADRRCGFDCKPARIGLLTDRHVEVGNRRSLR